MILNSSSLFSSDNTFESVQRTSIKGMYIHVHAKRQAKSSFLTHQLLLTPLFLPPLTLQSSTFHTPLALTHTHTHKKIASLLGKLRPPSSLTYAIIALLRNLHSTKYRSSPCLVNAHTALLSLCPVEDSTLHTAASCSIGHKRF